MSGLLCKDFSDIKAISTALEKKAAAFDSPEYHLKLLLDDPGRFGQFSKKIDGFFMDFSRQRLDWEALNSLYRLAEQTGAHNKFVGMTRGETVNTTENRAALHTAARGTGPCDLNINGLDVHAAMDKVRHEIAEFCQDVHSGTVTGADGRPFTRAVVVGIGGSYLGCEFVYHAMGAKITPVISLDFMPNVDIDEFYRTVAGIEPETTLWIVISKSFTTTETMANLTQVTAWLNDFGLLPEQHIVTVTAKASPGDQAGAPVLKSFHMFDFIGGRYSVSSAVGGLPLSLAYGFDAYDCFLSGCRAMDDHVLDSKQSLAMTAACISVWNSLFLKYPAQGIIPYSTRLSKLPAHIQQLYMESIGKSAGADGSFLSGPAGAIIFGEPGTNAQHSFFQLAHQGPGFPMDFIGVIQPGFTGQQALSKGVTNHQELWANLLAQTRALALGRDHEDPARRFSGNRPSSLIVIDDLSPERIGMLLAFYEARTVLEGFILGVNPFDQFGVELGKTMAGDVRRQMAKKNRNSEFQLSCADPVQDFFVKALFKSETQ